MKSNFNKFDGVFLIIFIISFLCLVDICVRIFFSYVILTYVGFFYMIGIIIVMILSGDYIIERILEWQDNDN